jgi:hypothetical protein
MGRRRKKKINSWKRGRDTKTKVGWSIWKRTRKGWIIKEIRAIKIKRIKVARWISQKKIRRI